MSAKVPFLLFLSFTDLMAMKPFDFRETLVNGGETNVAIYSNVVWNSATKEMTMWFPKNRLEMIFQYYFLFFNK
jgi:hypothetical protein